MKPQARKEGLVVKALADETLVYDLKSHRAHCLNRTSGLVFKHCDGNTSVGEMVGLVGSELGVALRDALENEKLVWLALEQLGKADLLETRLSAPPAVGRCSRREMVRRMGVGLAALLPLVTSIIAPTPVEAAASCVTTCVMMPFGTPCNDCIDDYCDGSGGCVIV